MVLVAWPTVAIGDPAPEGPGFFGVEAAARIGYNSAYHDSRHSQSFSITEGGAMFDGEAGIDVMPGLAVLGFVTHSRLPDVDTDDDHESGYSYHDAHVRITDIGVRMRLRRRGWSVGVGAGYEWDQFSSVLDQTDPAMPFFGTVGWTHSGILIEASGGYRAPPIPYCHCSVDVVGSLAYGGRWWQSGMIAKRIAIGLAFWWPS